MKAWGQGVYREQGMMGQPKDLEIVSWSLMSSWVGNTTRLPHISPYAEKGTDTDTHSHQTVDIIWIHNTQRQNTTHRQQTENNFHKKGPTHTHEHTGRKMEAMRHERNMEIIYEYGEHNYKYNKKALNAHRMFTYKTETIFVIDNLYTFINNTARPL